MSAVDFLTRLTGALETAAVPYMLAGSFASSLHGEPRMTQDVDLVVDTDAAGIRRLVAALDNRDYYVDLDAALDATRRRSQFHVIDLSTGWKSDLILTKPRPFSRTEFDRRQSVEVVGLVVWMASPEDVVISKLEWASKAQSSRQLRDVQGILRATRGLLRRTPRPVLDRPRDTTCRPAARRPRGAAEARRHDREAGARA